MRFAEANPIFLQIADMVCDGVLKGRFLAEERIPSVRDMAVSIEVNPNTVQRAYSVLQEWGVIDNQRGVGYSVAIDAVARARAHKRGRLEREEVPRLVEYLDVLGMSVRELSELVSAARTSGSSGANPQKGSASENK
jgi:DNA-binding transcriptional regulator YhcF (GntR family)